MATGENIEVMQLSKTEGRIADFAGDERIDAGFDELVEEILATASAHDTDFVQWVRTIQQSMVPVREKALYTLF